MSAAVIWHDLECGAYRADIGLWLSLAAQHGSPVLDVGAGTGRVALELARAGHRVTALDADGELLAELARRAGDLPVQTARCDARDFSLGRLFPLAIVPMQTIQLLGGEDGRGAFLRCARRHLAADGLLAIAIATELEPFEVRDGEPAPLPDVTERDGHVYFSQPTAVRPEPNGYVLERRRDTVAPGGQRSTAQDVIHLDSVSIDGLVREADAAGLRAAGSRSIAATLDHVGCEVVMFQ